MGSQSNYFDNWDQKGYEYAAKARKKAAATRAKKAQDRRQAKLRQQEEEQAAEDWYAEKRAKEQNEPARARNDHLLPDENDDLPF